MHELSDDARSILDLARDAADPTDGDRRRVTRAMVAQLGAAAVLTSSATTSSATLAAATGGAGSAAAAVAGAGLGAKVLTSLAVVGLVAGGVALKSTVP